VQLHEPAGEMLPAGQGTQGSPSLLNCPAAQSTVQPPAPSGWWPQGQGLQLAAPAGAKRPGAQGWQRIPSGENSSFWQVSHEQKSVAGSWPGAQGKHAPPTPSDTWWLVQGSQGPPTTEPSPQAQGSQRLLVVSPKLAGQGSHVPPRFWMLPSGQQRNRMLSSWKRAGPEKISGITHSKFR